MNKVQREQKLRESLVKIRSDFAKMKDLLNPGLALGGKAVDARVYLERQIGKYLKPLTNAQFCTKVDTLMTALQSPPLLNVAGNLGAVSYTKPNWDTEGDGPEHVSWKLQAGGGWAEHGKMGGLKIRINEKAFWMFPDITLRGVMVHEATHFALDTDDTYYSTFTRNSVMKALDNGSENADNWRIFYQKMSEYFARGVMEA